MAKENLAEQAENGNSRRAMSKHQHHNCPDHMFLEHIESDNLYEAQRILSWLDVTAMEIETQDMEGLSYILRYVKKLLDPVKYDSAEN